MPVTFRHIFILIALGIPLTSAALAAGRGESGGHEAAETVLIGQVILLILIGRGLGEILQRLGQPAVIGSLLAGLILGPSLFGWVWPDAYRVVFPRDAAHANLLTGLADVGVLMLLLLTGMEVDLRLVRKVGRPAVAVTATGIAVPFLCGFILGQFLPAELLADPGRRLVASLFLGTALSISSIKIVAMVVREMNFMRRDLGQIIVASAIMEDTVGWIIVAVTLGIAGAGGISVAAIGKTVAGTAIFLVLSYTIGRGLVFRLIRWANDSLVSEYMVITVILLVMLVLALTTQLIGVNTVLGAFVAGVLVGESPILAGQIEDRLRGFITAFLMPLFFGLAGLAADLTVLRDPYLLLLTAGLVLLASIGKFSGAFLGAKLGGLDGRAALAIGSGMNARGSTEVIIAAIGLSMGILSRNLYTMILSMAVLTTIAMPPMLRWALARVPPDPAEEARLRNEDIDASGVISRFERILVAADDSGNGIFATSLAGFLAGQRGHPMTVLNLKMGGPLGDDPEPARQLAAAAKDSAALSADVTEVGKDHPTTGLVNLRLRVETEDGPGAVAAEAAKGFDLLFIGMKDMIDPAGGFSDHVDRLAAGFKGPVVLVFGARDASGERQGRAHDDGDRNVLIPVNGTEVSRRGAELAFALVPPRGTRCTALHVPEPLKSTGRRGAGQSAGARAAKAVLGDVIALGKRHGFDVKTVIRLDIAPGEAILSEAARARANFLVIGANRRVGESLVLGKTVSLLLERWNGDLVILAI